ncbi:MULTISPECIES: hypothetical protein [Nostocales]|uniref:Uncharacterized protein n=3 Tax=Nostocales TaxID=1161 RepID=A0A0C1R779_9CYAN|nr:hypothetical protein [Tolypothrix bouteillei]KAF3885865.1 hypothetical protein DA73_0400010565 [Tolypothrix bouteillei VB521301]
MKYSLDWSSALFLKESFPHCQDINGSFEQEGGFGSVAPSVNLPVFPKRTALLLALPNTGTSDDGS